MKTTSSLIFLGLFFTIAVHAQRGGGGIGIGPRGGGAGIGAAPRGAGGAARGGAGLRGAGGAARGGAGLDGAAVARGAPSALRSGGTAPPRGAFPVLDFLDQVASKSVNARGAWIDNTGRVWQGQTHVATFGRNGAIINASTAEVMGYLRNGWIHDLSGALLAEARGSVTGDITILRDGPSGNFGTIANLPARTVVEIIGLSDSYAHIKTPDAKKGWIPLANLDLQSPHRPIEQRLTFDGFEFELEGCWKSEQVTCTMRVVNKGMARHFSIFDSYATDNEGTSKSSEWFEVERQNFFLGDVYQGHLASESAIRLLYSFPIARRNRGAENQSGIEDAATYLFDFRVGFCTGVKLPATLQFLSHENPGPVFHYVPLRNGESGIPTTTIAGVIETAEFTFVLERCLNTKFTSPNVAALFDRGVTKNKGGFAVCGGAIRFPGSKHKYLAVHDIKMRTEKGTQYVPFQVTLPRRKPAKHEYEKSDLMHALLEANEVGRIRMNFEYFDETDVSLSSLEVQVTDVVAGKTYPLRFRNIPLEKRTI